MARKIQVMLFLSLVSLALIGCTGPDQDSGGGSGGGSIPSSNTTEGN